MRKTATAFAAIALVLPLLSGCSGLFRHRTHAAVDLPDRQPVEVMAETQIAAGRAALVSGQYGAAVSAYRNARLSPAHAPEAYNGLAVAYAGIGRPDLAERYFRQAVAMAPDDRWFRTNLARFRQQGEALAARAAARQGPAGAGASSFMLAVRSRVNPAPAVSGGRFVRVELPSTSLVRVSAGEVRIAAAPPLVRRPLVVPARGTEPRMTVNSGSGARFGYPARITIERFSR